VPASQQQQTQEEVIPKRKRAAKKEPNPEIPAERIYRQPFYDHQSISDSGYPSCSSSKMVAAPSLTRSQTEPCISTMTTTSKPRRGRKQTVKKAVSIHTIDEVERQRLRLSAHNNSQSSLNRVENIVVQYNSETGLPITSTTQISHQEHTSNQRTVDLVWIQERTKRERAIEQLDQVPEEDAKIKSQGFSWYLRQLCPILNLFEREAKNWGKWGNADANGTIQIDDTLWTNQSFVACYLFGLESEQMFEQIPVPKDDEVEDDIPRDIPWLACLWTMEEMLQWCHNPGFVEFYVTHVSNSFEPHKIEGSLFMINSKMMAGYVTGQLLCSYIPELRSLMRKEVLAEHEKRYFPTYERFYIAEEVPPTFELSYDFHKVPCKKPIPIHCANHCYVSGSCFFLSVHGICDGLLIRLIPNRQLRWGCFNAMRKEMSHKPKEDMEEQALRFLTEDHNDVLR